MGTPAISPNLFIRKEILEIYAVTVARSEGVMRITAVGVLLASNSS
jgi:hypothetical protein